MALTTREAGRVHVWTPVMSGARRSSATGNPTRPVSARGASVGARGVTVTVSLVLVRELWLPSASRVFPYTTLFRSASLFGVTVSPARFQAWTSTAVLPAVAVKL